MVSRARAPMRADPAVRSNGSPPALSSREEQPGAAGIAVNAGRRALEMWGGLECTVARIGGELVDQTRLNGHHERIDDLDQFAGLGITAIRYPVVWERIEPDGPSRADWRWTDERLGRMCELGVRPIVTLLHHGNGPRATELTAPDFAQKFAAFATRVAERYPWLDAYTPINEPLTTARFCGLYGLWHPHARDHQVFLRILLNQVTAIRLAMRAIRQVNPSARLIQTEDLAEAHSTPQLAYQARHENARRWLTLDLLTGRVAAGHPLWSYLTRAGLHQDLEELASEPCPPDIVGLDYYPPSERFLDDRLERYPAGTHTSNGRDRYADLDAVRVLAAGLTGFERLALKAWRRYRLPLAATEVHLGCTREEQLRWLKEIWDAALRLRARGADVRAVTAWALLGSYDWDSLLTRRRGHYETGAFDVRAQQPRPTAVARLTRDLATKGDAGHPVLEGPGWWRRSDRLLWPAIGTPAKPKESFQRRRGESRPLLIAGGSGRLGLAVVRSCIARGLLHHAPSLGELDIADPQAVAAVMRLYRPWAVVNAAGFARPEAAEEDPGRCRRTNVDGSSIVAAACAAASVQLLAWSTHLVFDGRQRRPYLEGDAPAPCGVYATSKLDAERMVLASCPQALLVRAGPLFGPWDQAGMVSPAIRRVRAGRSLRAAEDVTISPSYLPHLVAAALDLLIDGECGVWHLANQGEITHAEFARAILRSASLPAERVQGVPAIEMGWAAPRPVYSVLGSDRGLLMPPLDQAIAHCLESATEQRVAAPAANPDFLLPTVGRGHRARITANSGAPTGSAVMKSCAGPLRFHQTSHSR
jgi:dTDP-4-dehydrorhamnose reductase